MLWLYVVLALAAWSVGSLLLATVVGSHLKRCSQPVIVPVRQRVAPVGLERAA